MQIKQSLNLAAVALAVTSLGFAQEPRSVEPGITERHPTPDVPPSWPSQPRFAEVAVDRVSAVAGETVRLTVTSKLRQPVWVVLRFRDDEGRVLSEMTTELLPFDECTFEMDAADPLLLGLDGPGGAIQVTASYEVVMETLPTRRPSVYARSFPVPALPLLDAVVEVIPDSE